MKDIIRFMGVNKDTRTAGPGKRLELFTKGCIRGVISPCEGCFNQLTWTFEGKFRPMNVDEVVDICLNDAWNRQVTFCGGEPILQGRALMKVAKKLKQIDPTFHFVMYTAYQLDVLMKSGLRFMWKKNKHEEAMMKQLMDYSYTYEIKESDLEGNPTKIKFTILTPEDIKDLMSYIDIIVDGDFQMDKRLTTSKYMHDGWFIGSSNQRVFFAPDTIKTGEMQYMYADKYNEKRLNKYHCKTCGHETNGDFCSSLCEERFISRNEEMKMLGGA